MFSGMGPGNGMGRGGRCLLAIVLVLSLMRQPHSARAELAEWADNVAQAIREIVSPNEYSLGRHMMLQQFFTEERVRSEGGSGLKQVRMSTDGTRPYHSETHSSASRVASVHDHSNYVNTVGMGELIAVLNGVEFRTRHNDYKLKMPSTTSSDYEVTEDIPYPGVPAEVTEKETVDEQVEEMTEWFKAWQDQDHSVRDYREFFKPVLCYLEGAWTTTVDGIQEAFDSDRHAFDADTWSDMQEKVRFLSASGAKSWLENIAFLPTTIIGFNGSIPQLAQWNYRILCHPLKRDVPLNRLRVVDEFATRMRLGLTLGQLEKSRAARFQVNPVDTDGWEEGMHKHGLLDELMYEIPGKDNYVGDLEDDLPEADVFNYNQEPLNAARYHRWFRLQKKDALGTQVAHRGFSDPTVFMAMTTQPQVAALEMTSCKWKTCRTVSQSWSYAIPLELIYLTPLSSWNPHNLENKGDFNSDYGKSVNEGARNGGQTTATALDGINNKFYYMTPDEFFSGREQGRDAADTTKYNAVGVLDQAGDMHLTRASGVRVFFPSIPDLGILRQRYPIMPVHGEGGSVWKELEALKDAFKQLKSTVDVLVSTDTDSDDNLMGLELEMKPSSVETGQHTHDFDLTPNQLALLESGQTVQVETDEAYSHTHTLTLVYNPPTADKSGHLSYTLCDEEWRCWDRHPRWVDVVTF